MKDKAGHYGLIFRVLANAQDGYADRVILYVTLFINNPEKKGNIHDLVMEILNTGRNVTGDQLYSAIDIIEALYPIKKIYLE